MQRLYLKMSSYVTFVTQGKNINIIEIIQNNFN